MAEVTELETYLDWIHQTGIPSALSIGSPGREFALSRHVQRMRHEDGLMRGTGPARQRIVADHLEKVMG